MHVSNPTRPTRPRPFHAACLLHAAWIVVLIAGMQVEGLLHGPASVRALLATKVVLEAAFAIFLVATLLKCLEYRLDRRAPLPGPPTEEPPPLAILYLCCGDLDEQALHSLARVTTGGEVALFVHDDEGRGAPGVAVQGAASRVAKATGVPIVVLSRPVREGGKPGAVNFAVEHIPSRFQVLLLADADSYALETAELPRALARFRDPRVGAVQFRNAGVHSGEEGPVARALVHGVDVFDLFASHQARHGFMPFLGHNGLLRISALRAVGGLTPGMLSDDIDLSVRLGLAGHTIEYAHEVVFGETVPRSYMAFRERARKWAVGCTQVLRRHLWSVLGSPRLTWRQKVGFVEFAGFYVLQVSVIGYLVLSHVLVPILAPAGSASPAPALLAGTLVCLAVLAPALTKPPAGEDRLGFAWRLALAYGSLALATAHGVVQGILRGGTEWVPTARAGEGRRLPFTAPLEVGLGLALFLVPMTLQPVLLAMPSTYLFAAVYLSVPLLAAVYRPRLPVRHGAADTALLAACGAGAAFPLVLGVTVAISERSTAGEPRPRVAVQDGKLLVAGERFLVKGIHYSPYLPGKGPRDGGWPEAGVVEADFDRLRELGVNTLLVYDAPLSLLDRAQRAGYMVIYALSVNWHSLHDEGAFAAMRARAEESARLHGRHPALLYYLIGNEVPEWIVQQRGAALVADRIASLAEAVRAGNPGALVSHANWPPNKDLALPFLDVVSFNLYPSWPHEVAVKGYGAYIEEVLLPRAGDRPLVITEFGQNSLEASEERQAELLASCWSEIRRLTQGGVVFSFADEWWKNYDNPIQGGKYWERAHDPNDHLAQDLDPEEHYGIVTVGRQPKVAYEAVRAAFRGDVSTDRDPTMRAHLPRWVFLSFLGLVLLYTVYAFWPRKEDARA